VSAPELCIACKDGDDRHCVCAVPRGPSCIDELELFNDGIHTERARVRALLTKHTRYAHNVAILPADVIAELLGSESGGEG
jgi:hypothetical protein